MQTYHHDYENTAKRIVDHVGKNIVIGVPLGIGKPIGLLNALYKLASADESIQLTIMTGLTLSRPSLHNDLEKRLVTPILDRILKDYEDPLYEKPRELQQLPKNINVIEFFLSPGKYLRNNYVQKNYISSAYTNVARDTIHRSINVLSQQVAYSNDYPGQYSLSCNADLFNEVEKYLTDLKRQGKPIAIVAEVNLNLPFLLGQKAVINADVFTDIIDTGHYKSLFSVPRDEISIQDHLIGLYTSCLIKDDGCLQIGIGKLSNAVANALIMRHKNNDVYLNLLKKLSVHDKFGDTLFNVGQSAIFEEGLYASTEMLSDEYMQLYKENILKKCVYDHIGLQRLLNNKIIKEKITPKIIDILLDNKIINSRLTAEDVLFLCQYGIFKTDITYDNGELILSSGEKILADLSLQKQKIIDTCLGDKLLSGKIMHAGFFLGSEELYTKLRSLSFLELQKFEMTSVSRTNTLTWNYELASLQRQHARFINSAMMITLGGAIVSDGLENLREVSGVGGQFDFVLMANQLKNARSIINCRSTRETKKGFVSNIIWDYPNMTIPRYLRDIFITEYGIADCRSKMDSEIIQAILNITDSRFQPELLEKAKKYGKVSLDYEIPSCYQNNLPQFIEPVILDMQTKGYFKPYPFGSDLTDEEQVLAQALLHLKNYSKIKLVGLLFSSIFYYGTISHYNSYLSRMQLLKPKNTKEFIYKKLLIGILRLL